MLARLSKTALPALLAAGTAPAHAADAGTLAAGATAGFAGTALLAVCGWLAKAPLQAWLSRCSGRRHLRQALRGAAVDVLEDFILPGAYDGLTHIHYAALTRSGIVCLQVRHCRGKVCGTASEPQWRNTATNGTRRFLNPLIQNNGHVKAMARILPDVPIANLVVFTGPVRFERPIDEHVIHLAALPSALAALPATSMPEPELHDAWRRLRASAMTDTATRKDLDAQLSFG